MAKRSITVLDMMEALPGWFGGPSWANWRVVLKALFALPMEDDELALFQRLSGRTTPPAERVKTSFLRNKAKCDEERCDATSTRKLGGSSGTAGRAWVQAGAVTVACVVAWMCITS